MVLYRQADVINSAVVESIPTMAEKRSSLWEDLHGLECYSISSTKLFPVMT